MLFMSGICGILSVLSVLTKNLSPRRRQILACLEFAAMLLLVFDRLAYLYRGDTSSTGFWMVRISNFLVYFITLYLLHAVTLYLSDLIRNEGGIKTPLRRLRFCEYVYAAGVALLVLSQFTGLYYTFDENNLYRRAPGNIICFIIPFIIAFIQMSVLAEYHARLNPRIVAILVLNTLVPFAASVVQIFVYGVSLANMSFVGMAIFLYIFALNDLNTSLDESRQELIKSAMSDDLTGIPNMRKFEADANAYAEACKASGEEPYYIVFNIMHFQTYNDRQDYSGGDMLLKEMGQTVVSAFAGEPAARESADSFVVLTRAKDYEERVMDVRRRILDAHPSEKYLDVKAGSYQINENYRGPRHAIDRAHYALKKIRNEEDIFINEYNDEISREYLLRQFVLNNLENAINEGHIKVFYQPVILAKDESLTGFEALVRWDDPKRGLLLPGLFIPILEEVRQIHKLDLCVYETVCRQLRTFMDMGYTGLPVSLNFSRLDFELMDAVTELENIVGKYSIPKDLIHVEITESALMSNVEDLKVEIRRLHENGHAVWLDDFGSAYSSMNVLKDYDFDFLKIDMEFLRNFDTNPNSRSIISSVIELADKLGMNTLCEGVETREAADFLRSAGCGRLQGYYYGRPMPYDEVLEKIQNGKLRISRE